MSWAECGVFSMLLMFLAGGKDFSGSSRFSVYSHIGFGVLRILTDVLDF